MVIGFLNELSGNVFFAAALAFSGVELCTGLMLTVMKNNILASEVFSRSNKHYFLDFKVAQNRTNYLKITRSDRQPDNTYIRYAVVIWQEDFHCMVLAFTSLLQTAIHLERQDVTVRQLYLERKERSCKAPDEELGAELRPREKLMEKGVRALSDAELLALLIGSGSVNESAVSLGEKLMQRIGQDPARKSGRRFSN